MTEEPALFLAPVALFALGALLAIVDRRPPSRLPHLVALVASVLGVAISVQALLLDARESVALLAVAPYASLSFRLDPLAAFFTLVIYAVAAPVSLYALGYLGSHGGAISHLPSGERGHEVRSVLPHGSGASGGLGTAGLGAALNGFLAAMALVVLADGVFAFLFAWELMSLVSFLLVIADHRRDEARRAGFVYFVMTHVSTAFLVVAFLVLYASSGSLDFEAIRRAAPALPAFTRDAVFLLALVAFATKAGVIPLHVWLPLAHPAAPSHVSALMSGVMIKTAIYGLLRVSWDLAGPGPAWWGGLVLVLGVVSAVLGVLYALMEHDLKRLLAYHSVENIGIILMGVGSGFLLLSLGQPALAAIGFLAGLYHVLNHAVFKSLLFLGAGAIQSSAHTRDLESLGGLIHRMPATAGAFLVGAAAISALPPLNGFVSEWLTFQALLSLGVAGGGALAVGAAVSAGALALTGGLAAFCFVKAFGVAFLGVPRTPAAAAATECHPTMRLSMGFLALLCVGLGLLSPLVSALLGPLTRQLAGVSAEPALGLAPLALETSRGALAPAALLALLVALGLAAWLLGRAIGGPARSRVAPPWVCGVALEPRMQYSASALAQPIRVIFSALVRPFREVEREYAAGGDRYFVSAVRYEAGVHPIYERYLYKPFVALSLALARRIRAVQNGSLRAYLAYMVATLVVVLLLTR